MELTFTLSPFIIINPVGAGAGGATSVDSSVITTVGGSSVTAIGVDSSVSSSTTVVGSSVTGTEMLSVSISSEGGSVARLISWAGHSLV